MKCFNPYFKFEIGRGYLPFPCGCCPPCRAQKAVEWSLRMQLESLYYAENAFVTLTYSPEYLPAFGSLCPSHLQAFLKRLRRRLPYKIRYFACGEYGDKFGRAHYHLIIFGLKFEDYSCVYDAWKMGRVECEKPNSEAFKYVAGYVNKKIGRQKEWIKKNPNLYPMFSRCSVGLGLRFVLEQMPFYSDFLYFSGKKYYLGRYLRNKLAEKFGVLETIKEKGLNMLEVRVQELLSSFYSDSDEKTLQEYENIKKLLGFSSFLSFVWSHIYSGFREHYLSLMKIRMSKYRKGGYNNGSVDSRVRRVFVGT